MLAFFQYSPVPIWAPVMGPQPGFILEGETFEDLAWDLVEQFFDGFMTQDVFRGTAVAATGGIMVMDASAFEPSLGRALAYHEARFGCAWWHKQMWMVADFFSQRQLGHLGLPAFQARFQPEALLAIYLTTLIGRHYAVHHGMPDGPLTPESAIDYFERNRYLRWLDEADPQAVEALLRDGALDEPPTIIRF